MPVYNYHNDQLWVEFDDGEKLVTIGITEKASDKLISVDNVDLPTVGDDFDKGDVICEIHGEKGKVKIIAPAAGFVSEVNDSLSDEPELLIEAPNDEGWIVKIEIQDPTDLAEYEE